MNPLRLLLVEDDAVSRVFLSHALECLPAALVEAATDASQALALAREHVHAIWLLDANLPDASGEQLLRKLRALHADVPALCLTAEVHPERLEQLQAAGFLEVLQKPLAIAELHAAVRRTLAASQPGLHDRQPVWDDARALRALGGNVATMRAMRALFVAELPTQSEAILRATAVGDAQAARAALHRLKASCGFTGSTGLLDAVCALSDAPHDPLCAERFRAQVGAALATGQSES
jgi:CheY-like chemotaxis protein